MASPLDPTVPALVGAASALIVWGAQTLTHKTREATRRGAVSLMQDAAIALSWFSPTPRATLLKACDQHGIPVPPSHYVERLYYRLDRCSKKLDPPTPEA